MNPCATTAITLPGHQVRRLSTPARIRTERGLLWITIDGRPEDILLAAGESRRFERDDRVIVYALGGEARFEVSDRVAGGPARARGWVERLTGAPARRGASPFAPGASRRFMSWLRGALTTRGSGA